jgi:glycogen debranching enzyme
VFTDQHGSPFDFKLTTQPHALLLETRLGTFQVAIHERDALVVGLPSQIQCGIKFRVHPPLRIPSTDDDQGRFPRLEIKATVSRFEKELIPSREGMEVKLKCHTGEDDALHLQITTGEQPKAGAVPFSQVLKTSTDQWRDWFARVPTLSGPYQDLYHYAWWVLGNNLINPQGSIPFRGVMPSKAKYIGIWNWDACFHALALRHMDPELARDQLRIILAHQKANGMLPDAVHQDGVVDWIDHPFPNAVTKPPLLAWTALKIHEVDPQPSFLEEIYPGVVAWHDWWFSGADDHGLAQYHHPYSSGLDDSPLWDDGFPVTSPDLNTYLVIQRESLAEMCQFLGKEGEAATWLERADDLIRRMIEYLYDPDLGYFPAKHGEKAIPALTPFNLYPLWTSRLPSSIQNRLLEYLKDQTKFWSAFPLATVAMDSPSFDPHTMWRGPTWVNINYLFIQALFRIRESHFAQMLRERTLALVGNHPGLFEYYHPQTGLPPVEAAPMFSWTAAVIIDLLLGWEKPGKTTSSTTGEKTHG